MKNELCSSGRETASAQELWPKFHDGLYAETLRMQVLNQLPEKKALRQRKYCWERHGEANVQGGHEVKSAWKWGMCRS